MDSYDDFQTLWFKVLKTMVVVCQSAELKTFEAFQAQKVTIEELREKCHDQQSVNSSENILENRM